MPLVREGDGLPEAVHCLCAHNTFFKMVPIHDSFWKECVFKQFRFALHSLKTPAVIGYLSVNDIMLITVFKLPRFNLAFTTDWCQIVMGLQCRHQPLDHLEE